MHGEIMLSDSTPTSLIVRANLNNFSVEEKTRREAALLNKDFFYSRQESYVEKVNNEVNPVTLNLTNVIVKKKCTLLYSRPLVREFIGPAESVSFLEDLMSKVDVDFLLANADLASELTGTALFFVGIDENGDTILRLYDASEFSVVQAEDNPNEAQAVSIISKVYKITGSEKDPSVETNLQSEIWTDNYITTYVNNVRKGSEPNKLQYLPFVAFKGENVYGQFLGHAPATSVRQLNQYINQQLTNLGYMIKMQSATPIVLTGFQQGEGVTIHPGRAMSLPAGATAAALALNPAITETLEEIKFLEEKIYECSAIPKISVTGNDKGSVSGKELLIKWAPLLQVFKGKSLRFRKYELDLFNMILKVNNLSPLGDLNVKYPEEAVLPYSPESENLEKNVKYGIQTPIDELLKIDPTLDETEAETIIRANLQFNKSIGVNNGKENTSTEA